jgi:hypothetical protein
MQVIRFVIIILNEVRAFSCPCRLDDLDTNLRMVSKLISKKIVEIDQSRCQRERHKKWVAD